MGQRIGGFYEQRARNVSECEHESEEKSGNKTEQSEASISKLFQGPYTPTERGRAYESTGDIIKNAGAGK